MKEKFTSADNICLCIAVSLTVTFYGYEKYISASIMGFMYHLAVGVMVFSWVFISFAGGRKKNYPFAVFTALYWTIPSIAATLMEDPLSSPDTFSTGMYAVSSFLKFFTVHPLDMLSDKTDNYLLSAVIFVAVCEAAYFAGFGAVRYKEKRGNA